MKLFKFCPMNHNSLKMIVNDSIWFSRPSKFNDFFDSNTKYRFGHIGNSESMVEYFDNIGVACFSEKMENPIMWAYYADSFKGFCIEFELDLEALSNGEYVTFIDLVYYVPEIKPFKGTKLNTINFFKNHFFQKCNFFKNENEYRLIAPQGDRAFLIPNLMINKIHYGPKMEKQDIMMLIELCKLKKIKFNSAIISDYEYKVEPNDQPCNDENIKAKELNVLTAGKLSNKFFNKFNIGKESLKENDDKKLKESIKV